MASYWSAQLTELGECPERMQMNTFQDLRQGAVNPGNAGDRLKLVRVRCVKNWSHPGLASNCGPCD